MGLSQRTVNDETGREPGESVLTAQLLSGWTGLGGADAIWRQLDQARTVRSFDSHFGWYHAALGWLHAAGKGDVTVVIRNARDEPVAIVPLVAVPQRVGGINIACLGLPEHDDLTQMGIPVADGVSPQRLLQALLLALREQYSHAWNTLILPRISAQTPLGQLAAGDLAPFRGLVRDVRGAYYMPVKPEVGEWSIPGKLNRNLRRLANRARESGALATQTATRGAELDSAFHQFLEVEASGWKGRDGEHTATLSNEKLLGFYRSLLDTHAPRGECLINTLWLDGICIAAQFCLKVGGVLALLKIGFRESHAAHAPGFLLLADVIERARMDPEIHEVNLTTCPAWAQIWKPHRRKHYDLMFFSDTLIGRAVYSAMLAKRVLTGENPIQSAGDAV